MDTTVFPRDSRESNTIRNKHVVRISRRTLREQWAAWLFIAPGLLIVLGVLGYPIIHSLGLSLTVDQPDGSSSFGIENYVTMMQDPIFIPVLQNTLLFAAIGILGSTFLGLAMALVLNMSSPLRGLGRVAMLVPWSMSQVAVAVIWGWIYNGSYGALNGALASMGVIDTYQSWLNNGLTAFTFLGIAFIWSIAPYATLLFLSGLQAIPLEQYEAARVDGANVVQRFLHITLPWLRSSFLVVLVVASLEGFLAFTLIFMITRGGPGTQTTVLSWWGYATTFTYGDIQMGAAILYFLTMIVMGASLLYMWLFRKPTI